MFCLIGAVNRMPVFEPQMTFRVFATALIRFFTFMVNSKLKEVIQIKWILFDTFNYITATQREKQFSSEYSRVAFLSSYCTNRGRRKLSARFAIMCFPATYSFHLTTKSPNKSLLNWASFLQSNSQLRLGVQVAIYDLVKHKNGHFTFFLFLALESNAHSGGVGEICVSDTMSGYGGLVSCGITGFFPGLESLMHHSRPLLCSSSSALVSVTSVWRKDGLPNLEWWLTFVVPWWCCESGLGRPGQTIMAFRVPYLPSACLNLFTGALCLFVVLPPDCVPLLCSCKLDVKQPR